MRFHSIATALKDINSPFAAASKGEEEEEYDSAADEDFSADEEDEESLGDVDADIERIGLHQVIYSDCFIQLRLFWKQGSSWKGIIIN